MGESGCGKSTIAAVLTGRAAGYTGSVTLGGQELSAVKESALLRNVTLVSLGSHLFKGTVAENLRMAAPDGGRQRPVGCAGSRCGWRTSCAAKTGWTPS